VVVRTIARTLPTESPSFIAFVPFKSKRGVPCTPPPQIPAGSDRKSEHSADRPMPRTAHSGPNPSWNLEPSYQFIPARLEGILPRPIASLEFPMSVCPAPGVSSGGDEKVHLRNRGEPEWWEVAGRSRGRAGLASGRNLLVQPREAEPTASRPKGSHGISVDRALRGARDPHRIPRQRSTLGRARSGGPPRGVSGRRRPYPPVPREPLSEL
jgi:hypothetical protein